MTLVESPPVGRTVLVVLVATGTGALMLAARRGARLRAGARPRRSWLACWSGLASAWWRRGCRCGCWRPGNWNELFDGLDRGLAGVQSAEWPYDGTDELGAA